MYLLWSVLQSYYGCLYKRCRNRTNLILLLGFCFLSLLYLGIFSFHRTKKGKLYVNTNLHIENCWSFEYDGLQNHYQGKYFKHFTSISDAIEMWLTCFSMSCITESASFFHPKCPSDPAPRLCGILSSISISSLFFTSMVSMSVCGIAGTRPYKNFSNIAYLKCKLWQSNNSQGIYNLVCYQVVNDGFNNLWKIFVFIHMIWK